jgi:hypothetical protein
MTVAAADRLATTVCQDNAGTDDSVEKAKDGIAKNGADIGASAPTVSEGATILQLGGLPITGSYSAYRKRLGAWETDPNSFDLDHHLPRHDDAGQQDRLLPDLVRRSIDIVSFSEDPHAALPQGQ